MLAVPGNVPCWLSAITSISAKAQAPEVLVLWFYESFFPVVWIAFLLYWQIKAANTKSTQRLEPAASRILRVFIFLIAIVLLSTTRIPLRWLYLQLWPVGLWPFWLGAAVTIAGLLFAVWAREHLGRNWSRSVTIKQDHELITTGPYAVVRHPIYTGILTGFPWHRDCPLPSARVHRFRSHLPRVLDQAPHGGTVDALPVRRDVCHLCSSDRCPGALPPLISPTCPWASSRKAKCW
jgi:protein-S-isoprenylcysteine O-methyltransferase Ste14